MMPKALSPAALTASSSTTRDSSGRPSVSPDPAGVVPARNGGQQDQDREHRREQLRRHGHRSVEDLDPRERSESSEYDATEPARRHLRSSTRQLPAVPAGRRSRLADELPPLLWSVP